MHKNNSYNELKLKNFFEILVEKYLQLCAKRICQYLKQGSHKLSSNMGGGTTYAYTLIKSYVCVTTQNTFSFY